MNRVIFIVTGRRPHLSKIVADQLHPRLVGPSALQASLETRTRYSSTKASALKKVVPEFWVLKMKTGFAWNDVNGDGYITADDFASWIKEMGRLFPDMSEEQKKTLEAKHERVWGDLLDGEGKGLDYKVTESMYIEKFFNIACKAGAEEMMRMEWRNNFMVMDVDQDS